LFTGIPVTRAAIATLGGRMYSSAYDKTGLRENQVAVVYLFEKTARTQLIHHPHEPTSPHVEDGMRYMSYQQHDCRAQVEDKATVAIKEIISNNTETDPQRSLPKLGPATKIK
jgi:hypothetical protein